MTLKGRKNVLTGEKKVPQRVYRVGSIELHHLRSREEGFGDNSMTQRTAIRCLGSQEHEMEDATLAAWSSQAAHEPSGSMNQGSLGF